jgi:1-acyl-sn-glycerol-3-phosphate acyltransferase
MFINVLKKFVLAVFRLVFTVEYYGLENAPATGAVIVAGNHPSYLDPLLVFIPLRRSLRFMAWDALFKIPVAGQIIRAIGAFPVDLRKGKGEAAFQQALKVLNNGEALGIFPEGQRSAQGAMGELKTGVARLAIATGAPIVPVTIGGASRAWPKWKLLPKPAQLVVRFHEPITLDPTEVAARGEDKAYHQEVMQRVAERINRSLKPALHEASQIEKLYAQPPSNIRTYEWAPLLTALIASLVSMQRGLWPVHAPKIWLPVSAYFFYLALDLLFIKPTRTAKWLRNSMPIWLIVAWHTLLTRATGLPWGERNEWLLAGLLLTFFTFFYEDYFTLQKFVRGVVVSYYFALALLLNLPHPLGVMTSLFTFAVIFCWRHHTWAYSWITCLLLALWSIALWLTDVTHSWLVAFALLPFVVMAYLGTFSAVAYDIRKAGIVAVNARESAGE